MTHSDKSRLQFKSPLPSALKRAAREEVGASLVEAALSITVLFALLFGIIGISMAVYSYHYLSNAAHEATRYAIVRGGSWANTCTAYTGTGSDMCMTSPDLIAAWVANRGFPGVSITPGDVCVQYFSPATLPATPSSACTGNTGPNNPGDTVQVTINYPYTLALPILGTHTFNLTSTSQMVIAQ